MFKQLKNYYIIITLPFALLLLGSVLFFDAIKATISSNPHPQINYTIFIIILVGGILIVLSARRLVREARSLVEFSGAIHAKKDAATLQEMANKYTGDLACILQMVAASGDRSISHQEQAALEHELGNTRARLTRRNALPQYMTGLLVGMGLLGTFIGLLATLNDISILISSFADLDMNNINPIQVFRTMIERMKAPMQSMAIAFSASMFGLLGSIILGLMMLGIRRLQGDISSLLNSEIARHIEIALSFESISFRGVDAPTGGGGDLTAQILLRIEERLAEAARIRQRALSAEIDDFKKQRGDMLRALTEQTEANNNFRKEMQQLGMQLASLLSSMEKGKGELAAQISDMTVRMAGDAKQSHKLIGMQVDEQKRLIDTLDSYKIEERLAEAAGMQQRALASEIDDFNKQRADMLRTLTEQTEASNNFRSELQQLGRQLGAIFNFMEKGNDGISTQISDLTVHMAADAKQSHILLNNASNNVRSELQQLGKQLDSRLGSISDAMEKGNGELTNQISKLAGHLSDDSKGSHEQRANMLRTLAEQIEAGNNFRNELQKLGLQLDSQLGTLSKITEKGNGEISAQISELMVHRAADVKETNKLLAMQIDEQTRVSQGENNK